MLLVLFKLAKLYESNISYSYDLTHNNVLPPVLFNK